jgi:signal peptidase II
LTTKLPSIEGNSVCEKNNGNWKLMAAKIAMLVFIADQLSKIAVVKYIRQDNIQIIPGFFRLVYWKNKGAAWGILSNYPHFLALLALCALVIVIVFFKKISEGKRQNEIALSLFIGGIAGNLFDRFARGFVVDFLDFYLTFRSNFYHWPAFNIADAALSVSVIWLIISSFTNAKEKSS